MSDIDDGEDLDFLTAFEDELYNETLSVGSDDSLDSELEAELYQNVHFASSLVETPTDNTKEEKDLDKSGQSIDLETQVKESNVDQNGESELDENKSFDDGEEQKDASKSFYPEVELVFSKEEQNTKPQKVKKTMVAKLFRPNDENDVPDNSSSDSDDWGVIAADLMSAPKKKQRNVRCFNCNERGHRTLECTEPKKVKICFLCGEVGHKRRCPKELCFNCKEPGHQVKNCPKPRCRGKDVCNRCHVHGHFESFCPDRWRQYHHTIKEGQIVRARQPDPDRKDIFCYNCGGKGHLGHECVEGTHERFVDVSVPFVVKYDRYTSGATGQPSESAKQNHQHGERSQNRKKRSGEDFLDGARRSSKRRKMGDGGDNQGLPTDHGWNYTEDTYDQMETFTDFGNLSTQLPQPLMSLDIVLRQGKKKKRKIENSQEQSQLQNESTQISAKKKKNRPNQFKRKKMRRLREMEKFIGKQNNDNTQMNNMPMAMPPENAGEAKNKKKKRGKRKNKFGKKDKINLASLSSLSSTSNFHSLTSSSAHVPTVTNTLGNRNQDKRIVLNTSTKKAKNKAKDANKNGDKRKVYFNYTGFL